MIFVKLDEIAKGDGKLDVLADIEWIEAKRFFQTRDDERETQRIESRIQKFEFVRKPRELSLLFHRNLLEL
jgi:hypothetical protein